MKKHRRISYLFVLCLLLSALPAQAQERASSPSLPRGNEAGLGATYVVNSAGDEGDPDQGDGICDTTGKRSPPTEYSGLCTLRAAIQTANNTSALDTITFNGPMTIQPATTDLSSIDYPVTIDGGGQVILDGSQLQNPGFGLSLSRYFAPDPSGSAIKGLTIRNFSRGISLHNVSDVTIEGNDIRLNAIGIVASSANTITQNLIVSNSGTGLWISGDDNVITGNKIGTDGTQDLGNGGGGVYVASANGNLIGGAAGIGVGGACAGDCNLISGNGGSGVILSQATDPAKGLNNIVRGNFIGTNRAGSGAIPNDGNGVWTTGDNNSIIGNLISGNGIPAASNGNHGIYLVGANGNVLQGNLIGSAINGRDSLGNYGAGINVYLANQNTIGAALVNAASVAAPPATCADSCNVILGNSGGISITPITPASHSDSNTVIGNFIGVSADGSLAPGNTGNGIFLQAMTTTIASNVIGGNLGNGIEMWGVIVSGLIPPSYNTISGNHIGVGPDGSASLGNRGHGILIKNSADNWIGGAETGQGNIIAHNGYLGGYDGIAVVESFTYDLGTGNRILGNAIYDNGGVAGGIGIDLRKDGPTPNDTGDEDGGPNHLQNYPVISRVRGATVVGTLESTPNATFRLEFFGSPACSPSGYGQGKTFLGNFDVTTGATGVITFEQTLATAPGAQRLTATATSADGSTSEFSACYNALVVNSTGDANDAAWDGFCNTGQLNANGDPECTLRAALEEANVNADLSTVLFDIPFATGFATISPQSRLPDVNDPLFIDGSSQPGVEIMLSGSQAGDDVDGLRFYGGGSTVRGLTVIGFDGYGLAFYQTGDNVIVGNRMGVEPMGFANGNGRAGIAILGGDNNRIGGDTPAEANIIGANGEATNSSGILIESQSRGNQIAGNFIGVLPDGSLRGNKVAGVYVNGSPDNTIGGGAGTPVACTAPCNVIGGNQYGVIISGTLATHNEVQGNFVGINPGGTAAAANTAWGVVVNNAPDNGISHNIISGNGQAADPNSGDGVVLNGAGATGNIVSVNNIGVNPAGSAALGNLRHGVWLEQAPSNTVMVNLISGNAGSGVAIHGAAATGNTVRGNRIGTAASGAAAIPNGGDGVRIDGAASNTIGGAPTQGAGDRGLDGVVPTYANLISGNTGHGVQITGSASQNNHVLGNQIGVNSTGTGAVPNGGDGVRIGDGASANTVGGLAAGDADANVIAGNSGDGVRIEGAGTMNNSVAGNFIGVLTDGATAMANSGHGVQIAGGASSNTVGGAVSDHGNTIARNGGDGVYVAAGSSNAVWQNRIFRNSGLGVDLGLNGVTPNDALDGDTGPNALQNFPLLTSVQINGNAATLKGALESTATTSYTLEFFANTLCDPSGLGEGETPLGRAAVTTDANGRASFTFAPTATVSSAISFTVTATDPNRNTSEFSPCAGQSAEVTVTPANGGSAQTGGVTVTVPAGAVAGDVTLALLPLAAPVNALGEGMGFGGLAFLLTAFVGGAQQEGYVFQQPVQITLHYSDEDIAGLDEASLTLNYWDGGAWADAATTCAPASAYQRQPALNQLSVGVCHLSQFALLQGDAPDLRVYLPLVER